MNTMKSCGLMASIFAVVLFTFTGMGNATALSQSIDLQGQGLSIAEGGVGLQFLGSGTQSLTVTIGGPVQKAILYWVARDFPCPGGDTECFIPFEPYVDQELIFDGTPITGTVIGTESSAPNFEVHEIGYSNSIEVTAIVQARGTGVQSFTIEDGNLALNAWRLSGAGLLVIYTDPSDPVVYRAQVFEGLDFAFGVSAAIPTAQVIEPVVFNHGSTGSDRAGELIVFVGDATPNRPDRIEILDAFGGTTQLVNQLVGADLPQWDTLNIPITIPAGGGTTTVQLFSEPFNQNPDSLIWEVGVLRIPVGEADITIEKLTNGFDADGRNDGDVPQVPVGGTVTWTYVVTNTGTVPIDQVDVAVTDDQPFVTPVFVPGGGTDNGDTVLSPGEVWEYTAALPAESLATSTSGVTIVDGCAPNPGDIERATYENVGTVTVSAFNLQDTDPSHYCNPESVCGLDVTKTCLVPVSGDLACTGKIAATLLRYIGSVEIFDATVTFQGTDKKDKSIVTYSNVDLIPGVTILSAAGENGFTIDTRPAKLGAKMKVKINGAEEVHHTSCSTPYVAGQPAPLDNPKGAPSPNWFVEGFVDEKGHEAAILDPEPSSECIADAGTLVTYRYDVINNGDAVTNVTVLDDQLGTIASGFDLASLAEQTLEQSAQIFDTVTNIATVSGTLADGAVCEAVDTATVTVPPVPPASCADGKPTSLVFEYTGDDCTASNNPQEGKAKCSDLAPLGEPVKLLITGKGADKIEVTPVTESINVGDLVTIAKKDGNRLSANTKIEIRQGSTVLQKLEVHTSCSKELNIGDQFGSLLLEEFIPE